MNLETIECRKEGVATLVTINRPKALNALNLSVLQDLSQCFRELEKDKDIVAVIITGAGDKSFVAGADIGHMQGLDVLEARKFAECGHQVLKQIEDFPRPVIAAVNGFALGGGCELALACDMRIASDNARFGQPEVNLGVIPGFGGTQRLPRLVGKGAACELLFTGDIIDAVEALRIGLVNRVVKQPDLLPTCCMIAEKVAAKGRLAVRLCKEAVNNGMEMDLARACSYEKELFAACFASEEQKEGMTAFLEKRPAKFAGGQ